ncbi:MAG: SPOR domain-containing protein [Bacteroidales bacterium]|nr:SPOR domain-containing protein [Bacteroidales bacterium]
MKKVCLRGISIILKCRWLLVLIAVIFLCYSADGQISQPRPSRQSAFDAFAKADFEKAYYEFGELLKLYTKDPLYKYYSGVCLVNLEREPVTAIELLQEAVQGSGVVRSVPQDALFWLARAQQMTGQFTAALNNYSQFATQAGSKKAREYNVQEFVRQCNERRGDLAASRFREPAPQVKSEQAMASETKPGPAEKPVAATAVKTAAKPEAVPSAYDRTLNEALDYQVRADSLRDLADQKRKQLAGIPAARKASVEKEVGDLEQQSANWQRLADQKYNEAQASAGRKAPVAAATRTETVVQRPVEEKVKPEQSKPVSRLPVQKQPEVFSIFEVKSNPVYGPGDAIPVDPGIPEGLVYRIQVAAFSNPVNPSVFKGLAPVYGFSVAGTKMTSYSVGLFRRLADANKALATVRQHGFRDAFIVSSMGGKPVSAERASVLEKEWGTKPFAFAVGPATETPADTVPPTLSFRVATARSEKPLKDDTIGPMRTIAGSRGLDIFTDGEGRYVYLIGNFITFESASEYADLLIRNGYRDAKVTAWLGRKEIQVETARQLFERPE